MKTWFKNWLKANKWRFLDYKWYRKWYGGKWKYCLTSLSMGPVWIPNHEHCGCFMMILVMEEENAIFINRRRIY